MHPVTKFLVMIAISVLTGASIASDTAKEKRWANQIVDALIEGEAVWLEAGDQTFLGIYTEAANSPAEGGAIVLHGVGVHPDWPQVISPLRTGLPEHGWATLSLQMPILPNDAEMQDYLPLFDEVAPRIEAGIAFLHEQGIDNVVLIGHSLGASMALRYLDQPRESVKGLVVIGLAWDGQLKPAVTLEAIPVPVLDFSGSEDQLDTLETAPKRAAAAHQGAYTQKQIEGANHFFDGREEVLVETVAEWSSALD